jgi:hypothetical protein
LTSTLDATALDTTCDPAELTVVEMAEPPSRYWTPRELTTVSEATPWE